MVRRRKGSEPKIEGLGGVLIGAIVVVLVACSSVRLPTEEAAATNSPQPPAAATTQAEQRVSRDAPRAQPPAIFGAAPVPSPGAPPPILSLR